MHRLGIHWTHGVYQLAVQFLPSPSVSPMNNNIIFLITGEERERAAASNVMIKKFPRHICGGENRVDGEQMRWAISIPDVAASFLSLSGALRASPQESERTRACFVWMTRVCFLPLAAPEPVYLSRRAQQGSETRALALALPEHVNDVWVRGGALARLISVHSPQPNLNPVITLKPTAQTPQQTHTELN